MSIGERERYANAGAAMRQAFARMVLLADPVPSEGDWRTFCAVLCFTVSYSKLVDRVARVQLVAKSGLSDRQVRRSLRRLAEGGVLVFAPGRGAGHLTVVGIPPDGQKAAEYQAALGLPPLAAFEAKKADEATGRKSGQPTRARGTREDVRGEDRHGPDLRPEAEGLSARTGELANDDVTGSTDDPLERTDQLLTMIDELRDMRHVASEAEPVRFVLEPLDAEADAALLDAFADAVAAGVAREIRPRPLCRYPAHRESGFDWITPDARSVCGVCHPPADHAGVAEAELRCERGER